MKKRIFAGILAAAMSLSLVACGDVQKAVEEVSQAVDELNEETKEDEATTDVQEQEQEPEADTEGSDDAQADDTTVASMSYADYIAADLDTEVTVDCYVQDNQSWWDNKITVYAADEDGAYFIYNMECTEDQLASIVPGAHLLVTGYKSEWAGEVEITDAKFEIADDTTYVAEPLDITEKLGTEEIADYMNQFVSFKGLTVAPSTDADGNEAAFLYNWDGSGAQGDDLYFYVADANGNTYQFCVESYLRGAETDVYQAVEALNIGDEINCDGFLYWYEGVNPHIVNVY